MESPMFGIVPFQIHYLTAPSMAIIGALSPCLTPSKSDTFTALYLIKKRIFLIGMDLANQNLCEEGTSQPALGNKHGQA